jgi:hypothetical protein
MRSRINKPVHPGSIATTYKTLMDGRHVYKGSFDSLVEVATTVVIDDKYDIGGKVAKKQRNFRGIFRLAI